MPSLSKIGDLSCITSCLVLPGFLMDTLLTLKENVPGQLIFIDFQKAFDSLDWNFLLSCLEAFNFGPDFIRWVKTFCKNIQSCVINNGLMSDYFTLEW